MKPPVKELFPFKIAAKLIRGQNPVSHDEINEFVNFARKQHDKYQEQYSEIMDLKRRLRIAEQEIQFLQVTGDS